MKESKKSNGEPRHQIAGVEIYNHPRVPILAENPVGWAREYDNLDQLVDGATIHALNEVQATELKRRISYRRLRANGKMNGTWQMISIYHLP